MKLIRLFRNSYERKFWDVLNRDPEKYEGAIDALEDNCETVFIYGKDKTEIRIYDFDPILGELEINEILEIADFKLVE